MHRAAMRLTWNALIGALLLIGAATAATAAPAPRSTLPETPRLQMFGLAEGLPSSTVYALAQDRAGYLWVATADGLGRYDGTGFRLWRYAPDDPHSLPGNVVQLVHVDASDRVWVAIEGAGLAMLDTGRSGFRHYTRDTHPDIGSDDVWAMTSTPDGTLWFGTYGGGLHRLDGDGKITRYMPVADDPRSLPAATVMSLAVDRDGTLWVATSGGLARWTGHDFERVLDQGMVFSVSTDAAGALWIGTASGLRRRDPQGEPAAPAWAGATQLARARVLQVLDDGHGTRWIATTRGLLRERAGEVAPVAARQLADDLPLQRTQITAILRDRDGGLWFASGGAGLAHLPGDWRRFAVLSHGEDPATPSADVARGASASASGAIWLVGANGGLDRLDPHHGTVERLLSAPGVLGSRSLWAVHERDDGSVWIGSDGGLLRYDPVSGQTREWRPAAPVDAPPIGYIDLLTETADGTLWLSANGGGVQARDRQGRVLVTVTPADRRGLQAVDTEQIAPGPDGALWLAGGQGLLRWDAAAQRFATVPGAPAQRVYGFAFDRGSVWLHRLGALEHYRWDGATLHPIDAVRADDGLPAVESGGVVLDRAGQVWLTTRRGLLRYQPEQRRLRLFTTRDGLPSTEFSNRPPLLTPDGLLLTGALAHLVLLEPARVLPGNRTPPLVLDTVSVRRDGDALTLPTSGAILLGPHDRDLRVGARLLSFDDPQTHRYRFMLDGFDSDWVEQPGNGERVFSRLEPGQYRLRVQARDAQSAWSAPVGFALRVQPPLWRSGLALAVYAALALCGLLALFALYRQRLRARHARQLRERENQLARQASEAKTRFLATLGHEIRTPMTGVLGMSELLLGSPLQPRQHAQVEAIHRAGERLLRLVNDALDLARIEAGKLTLDDAVFDLHALIDEVGVLLAPMADRKGLRFACEVAVATPRWLRGDAHRLCQVLLNLGNNAIKFTERGEVRLQALVGSAPMTVRLEVSDTGPGVSAEQRARVFARFEQADGARTAAHHGGSGLGLAICSELVELMRGTIDVDSTPGQGSRFRVELPLPHAAASDVPGAPAAAASTGARGGYRILLVEDDATVAQVLRGLLEAQGHQVTHAPQGLAALTELADAQRTQRAFELALLDLDLPGVDGLELARMIRGQGFGLRLIAVTARADAGAEPAARAAGMDDFLRKPVTGALLAATIERVAVA